MSESHQAELNDIIMSLVKLTSLSNKVIISHSSKKIDPIKVK